MKDYSLRAQIMRPDIDILRVQFAVLTEGYSR